MRTRCPLLAMLAVIPIALITPASVQIAQAVPVVQTIPVVQTVPIAQAAAVARETPAAQVTLARKGGRSQRKDESYPGVVVRYDAIRDSKGQRSPPPRKRAGRHRGVAVSFRPRVIFAASHLMDRNSRRSSWSVG